MIFERITNRRSIFKLGLTSLAAGFISTRKTHALPRPKGKGETKVVYLGGDQLHNGLGQVQALRGVFNPAGWRFMWTHDARYVTPKLISDADLLIITRWGGSIEGWSAEPIKRETGALRRLHER